MHATLGYFWYWGFKLFCEVKHPHHPFLKWARALVRRAHHPQRTQTLAKKEPAPIPKKLWIFWAQGWDTAPPLVKICRGSWVVHNPGWDIVFLSDENLFQYLVLDRSLGQKNVPYAAYSDIIRIKLLSKYGGVWVDATTFCTTPLDTWLPSALRSGFFAFNKPKTTIASWFLASEKDNPLVRRWEEYVARYWKYAEKPNRYFWVHYLFEYLIWLDTIARSIWDETPRTSSDGAYAAQHCLKRGKGSIVATCTGIILSGTSPVHKLDWKMEVPEGFLQTLRGNIKI